MFLQEGESEWDEVERELGGAAAKEKAKAGNGAGLIHRLRSCFDPTLAEAFVLTFLAEWGDRSQVRLILAKSLKSSCSPRCAVAEAVRCP